MFFAVFLTVAASETRAQLNGTVVYTQGAMTGQATVAGKLWGNKWMRFKFKFMNGKPGFNIIEKAGLTRFTWTLRDPDGAIVTDFEAPLNKPGVYALVFRLKPAYATNSPKRSFKMVIQLE
ncbi:MAG: hypothetical protein IPN69_08695 [Acidobacteria bacterium]|nr:hypothetical protein [Acidobacteriota bacterium]